MRILACLVAAAALVSAVPGVAREQAVVRPGFSFPADRPIRILVFRPKVRVGEQSAGGVVSPNAEWTAAARRNLQDALVAARPGGSGDVVFMPELEGEAAQLLASYQHLFDAVATTVFEHRLFKGDRLPTKKTGFEYTLGTGVERLGRLGGGDYGLFVTTDDAFGSSGRKMLQILSIVTMAQSGLIGAVSSGEHLGYAGLVDLRTGDLIWMNADLQMGGDPREADGAAKRVAQLLEDMPSQSGGAN